VTGTVLGAAHTQQHIGYAVSESGHLQTSSRQMMSRKYKSMD